MDIKIQGLVRRNAETRFKKARFYAAFRVSQSPMCISQKGADMIILIIFLILTVLSILVCCFVAGSTPYDREADDEAQLEFLRKYRESKNR